MTSSATCRQSEARHVLDGLTEDVCKALDEAWDTALTEAIMQLATPPRRSTSAGTCPLWPPGCSPRSSIP